MTDKVRRSFRLRSDAAAKLKAMSLVSDVPMEDIVTALILAYYKSCNGDTIKVHVLNILSDEK